MADPFYWWWTKTVWPAVTRNKACHYLRVPSSMISTTRDIPVARGSGRRRASTPAHLCSRLLVVSLVYFDDGAVGILQEDLIPATHRPNPIVGELNVFLSQH